MRFNDYLRNLIDRSGATISSISREIGAERTSIHKVLAGERMLPNKVVQDLARYFHLTLEEREEFFKLYNIMVQGEENYRNREAVAELLNNLASIRYEMSPPPIVPEVRVTNQLIQGEYAVRSMIRSVLTYETMAGSFEADEQPEIYVYAPRGLELTAELMELWLDGRAFGVSQLFCFEPDNAVFGIQNLSALRTIVPLCLASRGSYRPYYFCDTAGTAVISPLAYYIVTPNYLIQFDGDLSVAQVRTEKDTLDYFRLYFKKLLQRCELLTKCSTDIRDTLQELIAGLSPDAMCIVMEQPCPGRYFDSEIIAKYLDSNTLPYEQMFRLVNARFRALGEIQENYRTVFTEKGLREFAQTGVMSDMPPEFVPPLQREDVVMLLKKMRCDMVNGVVQGLIVRPMQLQIPDYLVIYVDENTGVHFYTTNKFRYGAYCCNIHITEESISRIMFDFVQSLSGSGFVYSQEEALRIMDQQIAEIETQMTEN